MTAPKTIKMVVKFPENVFSACKIVFDMLYGKEFSVKPLCIPDKICTRTMVRIPSTNTPRNKLVKLIPVCPFNSCCNCTPFHLLFSFFLFDLRHCFFYKSFVKKYTFYRIKEYYFNTKISFFVSFFLISSIRYQISLQYSTE